MTPDLYTKGVLTIIALFLAGHLPMELSAETIDRIMRAADDFASGAPQHDDMTPVVARVV
jgi:hypothetical protein